jgi:hypothetical protein
LKDIVASRTSGSDWLTAVVWAGVHPERRLSYNASLAGIIAQATSMRASEVGEFNPRLRGHSPALFVVTERAALLQIGACLTVDEASLAQRHAWMTPGIVQLNFLKGHSLLTSVVFIYSDFLRWPEGGPDARLANSKGLMQSLVACGWRTPYMPETT